MARKRRPLPPAPQRSARCYIRLEQSQTRLFRYLLEGYDNLAYTSVADRRACILKVVYSPHSEKPVQDALREMQQSLTFEILPAPLLEMTLQEQLQ